MIKCNNTRDEALKLFFENTELAYYTLYKYFHWLANSEDWQQEAMYGLWVACLTFNPSYNCKFSTYAITVCKHHISNQVYRQKSVPSSKLCTNEDITQNLDEGVFNTDHDPLLELYAIQQYFPLLTKKQQQYLLLVAEGLSFAQIGKMYHISRQSVQQSVMKARATLRRHLDGE